jgi:hypothetical protein
VGVQGGLNYLLVYLLLEVKAKLKGFLQFCVILQDMLNLKHVYCIAIFCIVRAALQESAA